MPPRTRGRGRGRGGGRGRIRTRGGARGMDARSAPDSESGTTSAGTVDALKIKRPKRL